MCEEDTSTVSHCSLNTDRTRGSDVTATATPTNSAHASQRALGSLRVLTTLDGTTPTVYNLMRTFMTLKLIQK